MSDAARYEGRPFLRLLDCYVLRAIGQLDEAQEDALRLIEPQLASVYGEETSWHQLVAKQMDFPDGIDANIQHVWIAAQQKADELNMDIDSAEFTRQFVDANFL